MAAVRSEVEDNSPRMTGGKGKRRWIPICTGCIPVQVCALDGGCGPSKAAGRCHKCQKLSRAEDLLTMFMEPNGLPEPTESWNSSCRGTHEAVSSCNRSRDAAREDDRLTRDIL